jgi:hypothetical protein
MIERDLLSLGSLFLNLSRLTSIFPPVNSIEGSRCNDVE